jgi:tetratricopeptide (TPR) repeat protein
MKKITTYALLLFVFIMVAGFIVVKNKKKQEGFMPLKERTASLATGNEYATTKKKADALLALIKKNPGDTKAKLELASLYIQEGRITGDHVYYDVAAMQLANDVLKTDSNNFEALVFKGTLYLSQHHFADGLAIAQHVQRVNPYNSFVYGMLVDANVELGNYDEAVKNSDRMVSIRPDIRSYSRISYLREIYGDYAGAIDAMKLAVSAGYPGDEGTAWTRVHLAQLYENTGDILNAKMHYTIALQERPDYAYAYAGLARIARAEKNYPLAINYELKADSLVVDYAFKDELTDLYLLSGDKDKSQEMAEKVVAQLSKDAQKGVQDASIGHYSDRELAYAYLKVNDADKALEHALMEYNRRPDNIDVNETLAWVYYQKGNYADAHKYINVALKTNSKNPTLLCHAGLIYLKSGDIARGKELINTALQSNPNINVQLKNEAQKATQAVS